MPLGSDPFSPKLQTMTEHEEIVRRLNEIVSRFWEDDRYHPCHRDDTPFNILPPNEHATKKEYKAEKAAVVSLRKQLGKLIDLLTPGIAGFPADTEPAKRLRNFVDEVVPHREPGRPADPVQVVVNAAIDVGIFECTFRTIAELDRRLRDRENVLAKEEKVYWGQPHRMRNHHAYAIAFRLARYYRQEAGKEPTYGTSSDGRHPSTEFCRALEEVYEVLGIDAGIRQPAEWAIAKAKESPGLSYTDIVAAEISGNEQ